jgi:hypothetical protein
MKNSGYTIRIFVPDGDPEGFKTVDQLNWTGKGLAFPKHKWAQIRTRQKFENCGVYILSGYVDDDANQRRIYIGQGDFVRDRLDEHSKLKMFWDHAVVFVSTSGGLNKAHSCWLEYALVQCAKEAKRCILDNAQEPKEPSLAEPERADTEAFLSEVLRILPLVGVFAFETRTAPVQLAKPAIPAKAPDAEDIDTIIVPAYEEGFEKVFLGQQCWYEVRIAAEKMPKIKYAAAYLTYPTCAITHFAPVDHIEPYGDAGKYKLVFSQAAKPLATPVLFGDARQGAMQGIRYTTLKKLQAAKQLRDLGVAVAAGR